MSHQQQHSSVKPVSSRCVYNAQGDMLCMKADAPGQRTHNLDAYGRRLSSIAPGITGIELFTNNTQTTSQQQSKNAVMPYEPPMTMFENSAKITSDMLMMLPTFPL